MRDPDDNKKSIVIMKHPKSYRGAYKNHDEEYSTIVVPHIDKYIMSHVDKLCEVPILTLPEDFLFYCDASITGLGAVLM